VSVTLCLSACAAFTPRAEGQTRMQAVERLYSSAAYEDALAALDTVDVAGDGERIESAEYRILCLLGMGERERAEAAIEKLVTSHPDYRPSPARFSPGRQEQFNAIRRQVLVRIFEASAEEATMPRISLIGELMGRHFNDVTRVADVYQPHPVLEGIETMRWLPTGSGLQTVYFVTGAKVNIHGRWLLKANVLTRLTDTGLKARFTPSIALDYAREF
jgi:hypothetical protein